MIGAGVFGAWCAAKLKEAGADVALVEAYGAGHARSSSGGESRIIRISYGGDPLYSALAGESLIDWKELSAASSPPVFYETGVLWFSPARDAYMAKSLAYLEAERLAHRRLDVTDLRQVYPQMAFADEEAGFLEEDTGALIAQRAVQSLVLTRSLPLVQARSLPPDTSAEIYRPADGVAARALVFACGPWMPLIFPELLGDRIFTTRQEVMHFGAPAGDRRFGPQALPVWGDFNDGDLVYGFPDLEGQGFKIAFDRHGPPIDPDTEERRISADSVAAARAYLQRRFPDLAAAPFIHGRVCQYENSSNGDFLIDRHPALRNVWLVGCGSGHGFKHGPAVGRIVAAHLADPDRPIEPRFSIAAKDTIRNRTIF